MGILQLAQEICPWHGRTERTSLTRTNLVSTTATLAASGCAFLCGFDNETGECFDHRKDWIEERQEFLEQIFAIELTGYGIMDNHMHHILYTRPDLAQEWTDREVVERWWRLHPQKKTKDGLPAELTDEKLLELPADRERVAKWRARLSSLSWYMKELKEDIARRANAEDDTRGHFWEARFKSPQLLDIVTLLICLLYVDLNPIRAGKATNAENAFHTSAHRRFCARELCAQKSGSCNPLARLWPDAALKPICDRGEKHNRSAPTTRPSDDGFLPMTCDEYLELVDWVARGLLKHPQASLSDSLQAALERVGDPPDGCDDWCHAVADYARI